MPKLLRPRSRAHKPHLSETHAPQNPYTTTTEPTCCTAEARHPPRAWAPQLQKPPQEKPTTHNEEESLLTATREGPHKAMKSQHSQRLIHFL